MQLIPLYNDRNIGAEINSANARELFSYLGSKQEFANWIKNRITQYGFVENEDYIIETIYSGKQPRKEYFITLDMAKELCMVENNAKGKEARRYFIECEKQILQKVISEQSQPQIVYMDKSAAIAIKQSEVLRSFAKDMLIADSGFFVPNAYLYAVYRYYVHTMRSTPIAMNKFFTALRYEMQKYGVRIVKAQKRLGEFKISDNLVTNKAYCTFGIKLSTTSGLECLIIDGKRISINDMNFMMRDYTYSYGGEVVALSTPPTPPPLIAPSRSEELIRENERLIQEVKRLKKALFKAKGKAKSEISKAQIMEAKDE